jgi:hypothetical protein
MVLIVVPAVTLAEGVGVMTVGVVETRQLTHSEGSGSSRSRTPAQLLELLSTTITVVVVEIPVVTAEAPDLIVIVIACGMMEEMVVKGLLGSGGRRFQAENCIDGVDLGLGAGSC